MTAHALLEREGSMDAPRAAHVIGDAPAPKVATMVQCSLESLEDPGLEAIAKKSSRIVVEEPVTKVPQNHPSARRPREWVWRR